MVRIGIRSSLLLVVFALFLSCSNKPFVIPELENGGERIDIIPHEKLQQIVDDYSNAVITDQEFNVQIMNTYGHVLQRLDILKGIEPELWIQINNKLLDLYMSIDFDKKDVSARIYLKRTFYKVNRYMLNRMNPVEIVRTLNYYLSEVSTGGNELLLDYFVGLIGDSICQVENRIIYTKMPRHDMLKVRSLLEETKDRTGDREARIRLESHYQIIEEISFILTDRLTVEGDLKKRLSKERFNYAVNGKGNLLETLKELKTIVWLSKVDYPYLMGKGYVETLKEGRYTVTERNEPTDKYYDITGIELTIVTEGRFKAVTDYVLEDVMVRTENKRYSEMEVFRLSQSKYLFNNEVLKFKETL